jgi:23S rRNA-/tRNA-specific pseudouridylate synthase
LEIILHLESLRRRRRDFGADDALAQEMIDVNGKLLRAETEHNSDKLEACYEAHGVVVFVKPVGITVDEFQKQVNVEHPKWANIHRLDKLVSGCLVGGLTQNVRSSLHRCITNRTCMKVYCALVEHSDAFPQSVLIDDPIKNKIFGKIVIQPCQTYVETIWQNDLVRCVLCYPITGRTHQIRRHLAMRDSQIVSIDLPKQVFLYLHALLYQFDGVTAHTPHPHWISHINGLDAAISSFLVNAALMRALQGGAASPGKN